MSIEELRQGTQAAPWVLVNKAFTVSAMFKRSSLAVGSVATSCTPDAVAVKNPSAEPAGPERPVMPTTPWSVPVVHSASAFKQTFESNTLSAGTTEISITTALRAKPERCRSY